MEKSFGTITRLIVSVKPRIQTQRPPQNINQRIFSMHVSTQKSTSRSISMQPFERSFKLFITVPQSISPSRTITFCLLADGWWLHFSTLLDQKFEETALAKNYCHSFACNSLHSFVGTWRTDMATLLRCSLG